MKTVGTVAGATSLGGIAIAEEDGGDRTRWDGWATFRSGPRHAGATSDSGPTPYATTDWRADLDGSMAFNESQPVVADGTLYLAVTTDASWLERSTGYVAALDAETGETKWKRENFGKPNPPAVVDDTVYVATRVSRTSGKSGLFALDAATGETTWSRTERSSWETPVVADGRVYASISDSDARGGPAARAFDAETGETLWSRDGSGGTPFYADGTVFYGEGTALNADDGSLRWEVSEGADWRSSHSVLQTVADGLVFGAVRRDDADVVLARSTSDGSVQWERASGEGRYYNRLTVADGRVFASTDGTVTALDAETGAPAWTKELQVTHASSATAADGTLYVGGQGARDAGDAAERPVVVALDAASGERRWGYVLDDDGLEVVDHGGMAAETPVVAAGRLYAATVPPTASTNDVYTAYGNLHVLAGSEERPPAERRFGESDRPEDEPVSACIETDPSLDACGLDAGDAVELDAGCSSGTDPEFVWEADGDEKRGESIVVTVPECGNLEVTLTVTDGDGDTDTASVVVSAN